MIRTYTPSVNRCVSATVHGPPRHNRRADCSPFSVILMPAPERQSDLGVLQEQILVSAPESKGVEEQSTPRRSSRSPCCRSDGRRPRPRAARCPALRRKGMPMPDAEDHRQREVVVLDLAGQRAVVAVAVGICVVLDAQVAAVVPGPVPKFEMLAPMRSPFGRDLVECADVEGTCRERAVPDRLLHVVDLDARPRSGRRSARP